MRITQKNDLHLSSRPPPRMKNKNKNNQIKIKNQPDPPKNPPLWCCTSSQINPRMCARYSAKTGGSTPWTSVRYIAIQIRERRKAADVPQPRHNPLSVLTCIGHNRLRIHQRAGCAADPSNTTTSPPTVHRCDKSGCDYETPLATNLRSHEAYHHTTITCHGCSKIFVGKGKLRVHERTNCGGSRS